MFSKILPQKRQKGNPSVVWQTEYTFLFAVGGDGCPFRKNESASSFLLSFINVGKRVASSNDNFICFSGGQPTERGMVKT